MMQPRSTTTPHHHHPGGSPHHQIHPDAHSSKPLQMAPMLAPNNAPPRPLMRPTLPRLGAVGIPQAPINSSTTTSNMNSSSLHQPHQYHPASQPKLRTCNTPPVPQILTPRGVPVGPATVPGTRIPSQIRTTAPTMSRPTSSSPTIRLTSNNHKPPPSSSPPPEKSQPKKQPKPKEEKKEQAVVDLTEDDEIDTSEQGTGTAAFPTQQQQEETGKQPSSPLHVYDISSSPGSSPVLSNNSDSEQKNPRSSTPQELDDDDDEVVIVGTTAPTPSSNASTRSATPTTTNIPNLLLSPLTTSPSMDRSVIEITDALPPSTMMLPITMTTEKENPYDEQLKDDAAASVEKITKQQPYVPKVPFSVPQVASAGATMSCTNYSTSPAVHEPFHVPPSTTVGVPTPNGAGTLPTTNEATTTVASTDTSSIPAPTSKRKDSITIVQDIDSLIANIPMTPRPSKMNRSTELLSPLLSSRSAKENASSYSFNEEEKEQEVQDHHQANIDENGTYKTTNGKDVDMDDDTDILCQQMNDWKPFVDRVAHYMEVENIPFDYFDVWVPVAEEDEHTATITCSASIVNEEDPLLEYLAQEITEDEPQVHPAAVDHIDHNTIAAVGSGDNNKDGASEDDTLKELQNLIVQYGSESSSTNLRLKHVGHATKGNTDLCSIFTMYHMEQFGTYSEKFSFPPGIGLPGRVFASSEPMWDDSLQTARFNDFPRTDGAKRHGVKKGVGIPLMMNLTGRTQQCIIAMYTTEDLPKSVDLVHKCYHELQKYTKGTGSARDGFINWGMGTITGNMQAPLALLPAAVTTSPPRSSSTMLKVSAATPTGVASSCSVTGAPAPPLPSPTQTGGDAGGGIVQDASIHNSAISTTTTKVEEDKMRKYCSTLPDDIEVEMAAFLGLHMPADTTNISLTKNIMALRFLLLRAPCRRTVLENDNLEELKKFYSTTTKEEIKNNNSSNQGNSTNNDNNNRGMRITQSLVEKWESICAVPPPVQVQHGKMSIAPESEGTTQAPPPTMAFSHVNWDP